MKLVRFPCGCHGYDEANDKGQHLILHPCSDSQKYDLYWREMLYPERATELGPTMEAETVAALQRLIADGYRLRELKHLLT